MRTFKDTTELNPKDHSSVGSVTSFYGKAPWKKYKKPLMFLSVSDCQGTIRLHASQTDTRKMFIRKMKKLRDAIDRYIDFLEKQND